MPDINFGSDTEITYGADAPVEDIQFGQDAEIVTGNDTPVDEPKRMQLASAHGAPTKESNKQSYKRAVASEEQKLQAESFSKGYAPGSWEDYARTAGHGVVTGASKLGTAAASMYQMTNSLLTRFQRATTPGFAKDYVEKRIAEREAVSEGLESFKGASEAGLGIIGEKMKVTGTLPDVVVDPETGQKHKLGTLKKLTEGKRIAKMVGEEAAPTALMVLSGGLGGGARLLPKATDAGGKVTRFLYSTVADMVGTKGGLAVTGINAVRVAGGEFEDYVEKITEEKLKGIEAPTEKQKAKIREEARNEAAPIALMAAVPQTIISSAIDASIIGKALEGGGKGVWGFAKETAGAGAKEAIGEATEELISSTGKRLSGKYADVDDYQLFVENPLIAAQGGLIIGGGLHAGSAGMGKATKALATKANLLLDAKVTPEVKDPIVERLKQDREALVKQNQDINDERTNQEIQKIDQDLQAIEGTTTNREILAVRNPILSMGKAGTEFTSAFTNMNAALDHAGDSPEVQALADTRDSLYAEAQALADEFKAATTRDPEGETLIDYKKRVIQARKDFAPRLDALTKQIQEQVMKPVASVITSAAKAQVEEAVQEATDNSQNTQADYLQRIESAFEAIQNDPNATEGALRGTQMRMDEAKNIIDGFNRLVEDSIPILQEGSLRNASPKAKKRAAMVTEELYSAERSAKSRLRAIAREFESVATTGSRPEEGYGYATTTGNAASYAERIAEVVKQTEPVKPAKKPGKPPRVRNRKANTEGAQSGMEPSVAEQPLLGPDAVTPEFATFKSRITSGMANASGEEKMAIMDAVQSVMEAFGNYQAEVRFEVDPKAIDRMTRDFISEMERAADAVLPATKESITRDFETQKAEIRANVASKAERATLIREAADEAARRKAELEVVEGIKGAEDNEGWANTRKILKNITKPGVAKDVTQVIAHAIELSVAILQDLARMGKANFQNFLNRFKEIAREYGYRNTESAEFQSFASSAYNRATDEAQLIGDGEALARKFEQPESLGNAERLVSDPVAFLEGTVRALGEQHAYHNDGAFNSADVATTIGNVLLGNIDLLDPHKTEHGSTLLLYVAPEPSVDGSQMLSGVNQDGSIFTARVTPEGEFTIDFVLGTDGNGRSTYADIASVAKSMGHENVYGNAISKGSFKLRNMYRGTQKVGTNKYVTPTNDLLNVNVNRNVNKGLLDQAWRHYEMNDPMTAEHLRNLARGEKPTGTFVRSGISLQDAVEAVDAWIIEMNKVNGTENKTLSQMLGVAPGISTLGDYHEALVRGMGGLGGSVKETSLKLWQKLGVPRNLGDRLAAYVYFYDPMHKIIEKNKTISNPREENITNEEIQKEAEDTFAEAAEILDGELKRTPKFNKVHRALKKATASPSVLSLRSKTFGKLQAIAKEYGHFQNAFKRRFERHLQSAKAIGSSKVNDLVGQILAKESMTEWTDVLGQKRMGKRMTEAELDQALQTAVPIKKDRDNIIRHIKNMREGIDQMTSTLLAELQTDYTRKKHDLDKQLLAAVDKEQADAISDKLKSLKDEYNKSVNAYSNKAYWPLLRFGKYVTRFYDNAGKSVAVVFTESGDYEGTGEGKDYKKQLAEELDRVIAQDPSLAYLKSGNPNKTHRKLPDLSDIKELGGRPFDASYLSVLGLTEKLDPDVAEMLTVAINSAVGSGSKGRMVKRKGVPGYSTDAEKVFQAYISMMTSAVSRLKYGKAISEAKQAMSPEADLAAGRMHDPKLFEYGQQYENDVLNPPVHQAWAGIATSMAYVYHLGLKPAFALVQRTQPYMNGMPLFGSMYGYQNASKALWKAGNLIWAHMPQRYIYKGDPLQTDKPNVWKKNLMPTLDQLGPSQRQAWLMGISNPKNFRGFKDPVGLSRVVAKTLETALRNGDLQPAFTHELLRQQDTGVVSKAQKVSDVVGEYGGTFAAGSEQANRVQTIIAGAILAHENGIVETDYDGITNLGKGTDDDIYNLTSRANDIINMTGGVANSPKFNRLRGVAGTLLKPFFQFKRIMADTFWAAHELGLLKAADVRRLKQNPTKLEQAYAYFKPAAVQALLGLVAGGVRATPHLAFATAIVAMILKAIGKDDEEVKREVENAVRKNVTEALASKIGEEKAAAFANRAAFSLFNGLPNTVGFNLSTSMDNNLVMSTAKDDWYSIAGKFILGAAGSDLVKIGQAGKKAGWSTREGWADTGKAARPTAAKGAIEAYTGEPMLKGSAGESFTPVERAMRALSMEPTDMAINKDVMFQKPDWKAEMESVRYLGQKKWQQMDGADPATYAKLEREIEKLITRWNVKVETLKMGNEYKLYPSDMRPFNEGKSERKLQEMEGYQR